MILFCRIFQILTNYERRKSINYLSFFKQYIKMFLCKYYKNASLQGILSTGALSFQKKKKHWLQFNLWVGKVTICKHIKKYPMSRKNHSGNRSWISCSPHFGKIKIYVYIFFNGDVISDYTRLRPTFHRLIAISLCRSIRLKFIYHNLTTSLTLYKTKHSQKKTICNFPPCLLSPKK